jgi:hypothetical protein
MVLHYNNIAKRGRINKDALQNKVHGKVYNSVALCSAMRKNCCTNAYDILFVYFTLKEMGVTFACAQSILSITRHFTPSIRIKHDYLDARS